MRKALFGCFITLAALQVLAADTGLKPGLWETRIVKQLRDGKDMTAQINGAVSQLQERLANMPPEQREKIEAMLKDHASIPNVSSSGAIQMCITPDMAKEQKPMVPREGCPPTTVKRSGNHSTFEFTCTRNGITTSGKGEQTNNGDSVSTTVDTTVQRANGDTHVLHSETEMNLVSADCGDVKPVTPPGSTPEPSP